MLYNGWLATLVLHFHVVNRLASLVEILNSTCGLLSDASFLVPKHARMTQAITRKADKWATTSADPDGPT